MVERKQREIEIVKATIELILEDMTQVQQVDWAVRCAQSAYYNYKSVYPDDYMVRKAIGLTMEWVKSPSYSKDGPSSKFYSLGATAFYTYRREQLAREEGRDLSCIMAASVAGSAAYAAWGYFVHNPENMDITAKNYVRWAVLDSTGITWPEPKDISDLDVYLRCLERIKVGIEVSTNGVPHTRGDEPMRKCLLENRNE